MWWPGDTVPSWNKGKLKELKNRCGQQLKKLSSVIHQGLRTIVPVYKTVPISSLAREAGIPPISILLHEIRLRQSLRIQTLDKNHPLKKRAFTRYRTRLTQTNQLLPLSLDSSCVKLDPALFPNQSEPYHSIQDIHIYTDGSCLPSTHKAGIGFVIYQAGRKIAAQSHTVDRIVEPVDTEILAISQAIRVSMQKACPQFANNIIVYSDNQTAVGIIAGKNTLTSRREAEDIWKFQRDWSTRVRLPHTQTGGIFGL